MKQHEPQFTPNGLADPIAISACCGAIDPSFPIPYVATPILGEDIMLCLKCGDPCDTEYIESE